MNVQRCGVGVRSALLMACTALLVSGHAAPPAGTPALAPLRLADGGLSISAPSGPVALGSGAAGNSFEASLGTVTVTAPAGSTSWTAWVAMTTSFTVQQDSQTWSLPNDRVTYSVGTLTSLLGALLDSCSYQASQTLDQTRQAARCSRSLVLGGVGGSVSWNPRIRVQTQPTDPAGTYSGTITHSVA